MMFGPDGKRAYDRLKTARPLAKLREGRNDWYRIKDQADGTTEVMIYDEIGYFGVTARDFVNDLDRIDGDITLRINSPGGEIFDGLAIYNSLKQRSGKITCVVEGLAASAASFIAMAGDEVLMAKNASMMIHDGHGLCIGNAKDMRDLADLLDKQSDNIASIYAEKAGGDIATWRDRMLAETWYSADEAVDAGLADAVQGASSAENSWDLSIFNFSGRAEAPKPETSKTTDTETETGFEWNPDLFRLAMKEAAS